MANNYCESSSKLVIEDSKKLAKANKIIDRVSKKIEEREDYLGVVVDVEDGGVWFHYDESITPEHVEEIAKALIEELEINEPFYCSWSYTCSKPRIDEFGGGAFVIQRGKETFWVDAMNTCKIHTDSSI